MCVGRIAGATRVIRRMGSPRAPIEFAVLPAVEVVAGASLTRLVLLRSTGSRLSLSLGRDDGFHHTAAGAPGCLSGWARANASMALQVSTMRLTVGNGLVSTW